VCCFVAGSDVVASFEHVEVGKVPGAFVSVGVLGCWEGRLRALLRGGGLVAALRSVCEGTRSLRCPF